MPAAASTPVPMLDVNRQNAPLLEEIDAALAEVTRNGTFINGPACRDFEQALAEYVGTNHAIGCASGSDALLLPLMAEGIGPGDEVLLPSFTFFATAGAVSRVGATPVFVDILPDSFNIDPEDAARKITPATKAIIPVHLFGQAADMAALMQLADDHNLVVIEDACQAIGSSVGDTQVGAIGHYGAFSFYPTKNLGGFGDGGIITINDDEKAEVLRRLRNHGQHPRYYHHLIGANSRLDAMQAAVLNVKLRHLDDWCAARRAHAERYLSELTDRHLSDSLLLPTVAEGVATVWNQFTVRVTGGKRDELQQSLAADNVGSAIYYPIPLHLQPCFASLGYTNGDLPHTELAALEVLSLPMFPEMTTAEQDRVVESITNYCTLGGTQNTQVSVPMTAPNAGANVDLPSSKAG
ncbi:DegT/DnrJ/EryC1/StrS family aminotransferase [Aeoliella mucimassa]|uniref:Aminotransferase n=1 Tax=Aeoliella mucimassa TaxID=2527972 RepID=A0A518AIB5_9BACT|nr:DegT/DnrJ/EryC1/StrS family aminotransferase [Aeoliella mucimassa]QDU54467.1 Aminotransferase [Aeoliella mucimassa]